MIKQAIEQIREQMRQLGAEILKLQEACEHSEYVEGLTMVACVQPIMICTTCGHCKPMPPMDDNEVWVTSSP